MIAIIVADRHEAFAVTLACHDAVALVPGDRVGSRRFDVIVSPKVLPATTPYTDDSATSWFTEQVLTRLTREGRVVFI